MTFFIFNERPIGSKLSASEFIQKKHFLSGQITRHGLGSGLYGYAKSQEGKRKSVLTQKIQLENPIILDTKTKFNKFVEASTKLNKIVQDIINGTTEILEKDIDRIKDIFRSLDVNIFKIQIKEVIQLFLEDYQLATDSDFLLMPINYVCILAKNGPFDGIYNSVYPNDSGTGSTLFKIKESNWDYPRHWKKEFDDSGGRLPFNSSVIFMSSKKVTRPKMKKIVF